MTGWTVYVPLSSTRSWNFFLSLSRFFGASRFALHCISHISFRSGNMAIKSMGVLLLLDRTTILAPSFLSWDLAFSSIMYPRLYELIFLVCHPYVF